MLPIPHIDAQMRIAPFPASATRGGEIRFGLIVSFLLHLLVALFLVRQMERMAVPQFLQAAMRAIPVDLVLLSEETASPPQSLKARVPRQMKSALARQKALETPAPKASGPTPPEGEAPLKKRTPDDFETRLQALARLRQPDTDPRLLDRSGLSDLPAASKDATLGREATYSIKDYVRAQVERRWNLDLSALGGRDFLISIRIEMKRDGTITKAEIVDLARSKTDRLYYSVSLSARNAVLLSSPVALPAGRYGDTMNMVLELNPRDVVR